MLREPVLRALFLIGSAALVGYGMITVLLVVFARDILHGSALVFGWLVAAQGIGGLAGAVGTERLGRTLALSRIIAAGLVATGLLYALVVNVPIAAVDVLLVAIMGLPITGFWISTQTLLQRRTPDPLRGRMFGGYTMVTGLATLVGLGAGSLAAGLVGVSSALDLAAGFYLCGGVIALVLLPAAE